VSSRIERLYPAEALITLNGRPRKAMADQITTASKLRLQRRLGVLAAEDMNAVGLVVRLQLGL
jgi:mRNA interferase MazF